MNEKKENFCVISRINGYSDIREEGNDKGGFIVPTEYEHIFINPECLENYEDKK